MKVYCVWWPLKWWEGDKYGSHCLSIFSSREGADAHVAKHTKNLDPNSEQRGWFMTEFEVIE